MSQPPRAKLGGPRGASTRQYSTLPPRGVDRLCLGPRAVGYRRIAARMVGRPEPFREFMHYGAGRVARRLLNLLPSSTRAHDGRTAFALFLGALVSRQPCHRSQWMPMGSLLRRPTSTGLVHLLPVQFSHLFHLHHLSSSSVSTCAHTGSAPRQTARRHCKHITTAFVYWHKWYIYSPSSTFRPRSSAWWTFVTAVGFSAHARSVVKRAELF